MPTVKEGELRKGAIDRLKYIIAKLEDEKAPFVKLKVETTAYSDVQGTERMEIHVEGMDAIVTTPVYITKGGE